MEISSLEFWYDTFWYTLLYCAQKGLNHSSPLCRWFSRLLSAWYTKLIRYTATFPANIMILFGVIENRIVCRVKESMNVLQVLVAIWSENIENNFRIIGK